MIATAERESEPVCIGGIYRLHDDDRGEVLEIPVAVDWDQVLRRLDEATERRERYRKAKFERTFSELKGRPRRNERRGEPEARIADGDQYVSPRGDAPTYWGVKLPTGRLIGIGRAWGPPRLPEVLPLALECPDSVWAQLERPRDPGPCPCCHDAPLDDGDYCLGCDRSAWDGDARIRPPSAAELRRMAEPQRRPRADDGLAGGIGGRANGHPRK